MKSFKGIPTIVASIAIQLCLGIAYIWSVFQTGIANSIFAGDNTAASLTFSLLLFMLSIGSVIGGKLAARYSTRIIVIIGGVILSAGFFLASFVTPSMPYLIWLGYGIMGGIGMGFTYSTTIAISQTWFPAKKGFITGLIVAALGFGGVIFTPIIESLINSFGGPTLGEPPTFKILSIIFLVVCTIGGFFLQAPSKDSQEPSVTQSAGMSPGEVLRDSRFYRIAAALMLACIGGLMMIGFAKPIAVAKGLGSTATIGVLIIAMFNSLGRLFWGAVSDKLGRKKTITIILIGSAVSSLLVSQADGYLIYALIALIGFCYGGLLSTFPSFTADLFGPKHMATNYGMVLIGFGVGAVISSYIAGFYKNRAVDDISLMYPAFLIAAGCACISILLIATLRIKKQSSVQHTNNPS